MSNHSCHWCRRDAPHVMMRIHTKEGDDCCHCKPYLAIDILQEPYISIAKMIHEHLNDKLHCCYFNIDSLLERVISMGLQSKYNKEDKK